MFRRFAARFVIGTSVLFLAMAGSSSTWAQYGNRNGYGYAGYGRYGGTTGYRGLPSGYVPYSPPLFLFPNRAKVDPDQARMAQNWPYGGGSARYASPYTSGASAQAVKPFSNYRPAPPIDMRKYQYRRR